MEKENNQSSGSFAGLNIGTLEKDLGMILPDNGEVSGKKKEPDEGQKKEIKSNLDLSFFSGKMQIPETLEEILAAAKGEKEKGSESDEEKDSEKQGKGGEDAIIKEDSPLYLHAATLHEEGILPTLDLESLKGKPFKEGIQIIKDEQKKFFDEGRNAYLNSLSDRQKEFLEMIELGIPQEQVEHQFTIEDAYSKVTDQALSDDVELQKQMITQNLKLKGLSDTKVQVFLKAVEDGETLFEEAKDAREDINAYIADQKKAQIDKAKNAQIEADEKEADLQKEIKTTIEKLDEILPGIKVSANEKTKLYEYMTKPVEEKVIQGKKVAIDLINKTRMENKVLFDLKLKYYIHLGLFDTSGKMDLTKIIKKVTSSNADKLTAKLKEEPSGTSGKGVSFDKAEESNKKSKIIFPQF
jgi:hypothetical protein